MSFFLACSIILKVYNDLLEKIFPRTFKTFFVFFELKNWRARQREFVIYRLQEEKKAVKTRYFGREK